MASGRASRSFELGLGSGKFTPAAHIEPTPGGRQGQLYNLAEDPTESENLWQKHPEVTALLEEYQRQAYSQ